MRKIMRTLINDKWEFAEVSLDTPYTDIPGDVWKDILIPHDFLITDARALYRNATGYYQRILSAEETVLEPGERLYISFDGVYMDSRVLMNGEEIAQWKYGYSPFIVDITDHIIPDEDNLLVVCIRHQSPNSRWYSGAGIFRDVTLIRKSATSIPVNGVYFHAQETAPDIWEMVVQTEIWGPDSEEEAEVEYSLKDPDGKEVRLEPVFRAELTREEPFIQGRTSGMGRKKAELRVLEQRFKVKNVRRWDPDDPALYTLTASLFVGGERVDSEISRVGFRTFVMDPEKGLILNGRSFKLNGVCEHHDLGAFGAAFHRTAFKRKIIKLKAMGVNAIRFAHNMAALAALELCDEMGILVISEGFDMWERPKTEYDYARFFKKWHARDVESWIRRDRNHPCIIMWSVGNEIYDTHADKRGVTITADLKSLVEKYDPMKNARVTVASNYMPWEGARKCADVYKIAGYNYGERYYEEQHKEHPDWVIYGSETASLVMSRGVYHFPLAQGTLAEEDGQCSSLGNSSTSWGGRCFEEVAGFDRDLSYSMGQFLWSGFDYIGEPTPYHSKNSYFGQIDTAGFGKDAFFFWQSVWTDPGKAPMVHIIPCYWDFNDGQMIDVRVVSNLDRVEFFVNGKSLGEKRLTHKPGSGYDFFADYRVPYEKGEVTAVAYDADGKEAAKETLRSFGDTVSFTAVKENDIGEQDYLFFDISAVDENGNPVGNASDRVHVEVMGPGKLVGLDNGDSTDYDDYNTDSKRLFNGKLLAIVKTADGADTEKIALKISRSTPQISVRKLEISAPDGRRFSADKKTLTASVHILPKNATDVQVSFSAVNDCGVVSQLVKTGDVTRNEKGDQQILMTAMGDGNFRLRAVSKSGTTAPRIISELEFAIEGVGTAYIDPYSFVSGSLFTRSIGDVGNGNEKGIASARDKRTIIIWDDLDFGRDLAESITLPLFTLTDEPYPVKIWKGVPGEEGAKLLCDGVYQKPTIWNTYQEETFGLAEPLTGIQTVSLEVDRKFHIKGFVFERTARAFAFLAAAQADAIYGDLFRKEEDAVYDIGNNVSIVYEDLDFGEKGAGTVSITAKGKQANSVHVVFDDGNGNVIRQIVEFPAEKDFTEHEFRLDAAPEGVIKGAQKVSLVFLPGTAIDLKGMRFI